ncbi:MAG TPA: fenitrothion hydrolase [Solirubrobacteraceae bacterium]|nr:fenitrothion hydrolase [Solirubrobacteraceae bacterium]
MKRTWPRALPALPGVLAVLFVLALAGLAAPAVALAHGIVGRADLPIPVWLFSWSAAIVLVVSFVALSTLWRTPRLQSQHRRRLVHLPRALEWLASAVGLGLFALVLYSGFAGAQVTQANFSVTFIYVIFWVGLPVASVLFGDVFRALSPWRTCARLLVAASNLLRARPRPGAGGPREPHRAPLRYPARLGMWPAVAVIVGFAWLELVYVPADRDHPATLAVLSLAYLLVSVAGMLAFGVERWGANADGFGAYFSLLARLSAICRDEQGYICLRRPLSALASMPVGPGTIALICAVIGTTTFDGFSNGGVWRNAEPSLQELVAGLGLNPTPAIELTYSLGLLFCLALVAGVYRLGIAGVRGVSSRYQTPELMRAFAHTLVPIGFAYVLAHYFSLLIWQGQAIGYLASDPLGNGTDLFGTSGYQIDYTIISFAAIWYVQVAALVAGHVGALTLAHDRALVLYRDPEEAVRSQYWMLAVMVAFTSFGLWLLSAVGT